MWIAASNWFQNGSQDVTLPSNFWIESLGSFILGALDPAETKSDVSILVVGVTAVWSLGAESADVVAEVLSLGASLV